MGEALVGRYYCHMCSQMVSPSMEVEIKCPFCDSGFVEEMTEGSGREGLTVDIGSSRRSLSQWAPILLGTMGNRPRRRRSRLTWTDDESDSDSDHDRGLESLHWRRRRSAAILQLLQGLPNNFGSESETPESDREGVILIDPFNQAVILQGSIENTEAGAMLGDDFLGPGLDLLLQRLAENDLNRYGTPPAKKEAVDAMPTVKVQENLNCSVCLEDLRIGTEGREMPCKHKFHSGCILTWLELHSSCPLCRFQVPADEPKASNVSGAGSRAEGDGGGGRRSRRDLREMFLSRSRAGAPSSSSSTSGNNSREDEN
ncbi:E3 ubiquitin-protein ligase RING1-like [Iris pallida]|uniref:RING-type E3 ubiquitin transferase n=1 Tax=Iris pallida TaxID=29817 RepID=A0AAX6DFU4_IRIPA|nr:E3 ubiquitin-protein ligase RING1-like [Iris pallida]